MESETMESSADNPSPAVVKNSEAPVHVQNPEVATQNPNVLGQIPDDLEGNVYSGSIYEDKASPDHKPSPEELSFLENGVSVYPSGAQHILKQHLVYWYVYAEIGKQRERYQRDMKEGKDKSQWHRDFSHLDKALSTPDFEQILVSKIVGSILHQFKRPKAKENQTETAEPNTNPRTRKSRGIDGFYLQKLLQNRKLLQEQIRTACKYLFFGENLRESSIVIGECKDAAGSTNGAANADGTRSTQDTTNASKSTRVIKDKDTAAKSANTSNKDTTPQSTGENKTVTGDEKSTKAAVRKLVYEKKVEEDGSKSGDSSSDDDEVDHLASSSDSSSSDSSSSSDGEKKIMLRKVVAKRLVVQSKSEAQGIPSGEAVKGSFKTTTKQAKENRKSSSSSSSGSSSSSDSGSSSGSSSSSDTPRKKVQVKRLVAKRVVKKSDDSNDGTKDEETTHPNPQEAENSSSKDQQAHVAVPMHLQTTEKSILKPYLSAEHTPEEVIQYLKLEWLYYTYKKNKRHFVPSLLDVVMFRIYDVMLGAMIAQAKADKENHAKETDTQLTKPSSPVDRLAFKKDLALCKPRAYLLAQLLTRVLAGALTTTELERNVLLVERSQVKKLTKTCLKQLQEATNSQQPKVATKKSKKKKKNKATAAQEDETSVNGIEAKNGIRVRKQDAVPLGQNTIYDQLVSSGSNHSVVPQCHLQSQDIHRVGKTGSKKRKNNKKSEKGAKAQTGDTGIGSKGAKDQKGTKGSGRKGKPGKTSLKGNYSDANAPWTGDLEYQNNHQYQNDHYTNLYVNGSNANLVYDSPDGKVCDGSLQAGTNGAGVQNDTQNWIQNATPVFQPLDASCNMTNDLNAGLNMTNNHSQNGYTFHPKIDSQNGYSFAPDSGFPAGSESHASNAPYRDPNVPYQESHMTNTTGTNRVKNMTSSKNVTHYGNATSSQWNNRAAPVVREAEQRSRNAVSGQQSEKDAVRECYFIYFELLRQGCELARTGMEERLQSVISREDYMSAETLKRRRNHIDGINNQATQCLSTLTQGPSTFQGAESGSKPNSIGCKTGSESNLSGEQDLIWESFKLLIAPEEGLFEELELEFPGLYELLNSCRDLLKSIHESTAGQSSKSNGTSTKSSTSRNSRPGDTNGVSNRILNALQSWKSEVLTGPWEQKRIEIEAAWIDLGTNYVNPAFTSTVNRQNQLDLSLNQLNSNLNQVRQDDDAARSFQLSTPHTLSPPAWITHGVTPQILSRNASGSQQGLYQATGNLVPTQVAQKTSSTMTAPKPITPGKLSLTFILPCPGDGWEWRAEAAHVGRRDALARICSSACYTSFGVANTNVSKIVLLFEDGETREFSPKDLVEHVPIPTETKMIKYLKDNTQRGGTYQKGLSGKKGSGKSAVGKSGENQKGSNSKAADTIGAVVAKLVEPASKSSTSESKSSSSNDTLALFLKEDAPSILASSLPNDVQGNGSDLSCLVFLGAVRDITQAEEKACLKVLQKEKIPVVTASIGHQAEFTSKIIDVLLGAHAYGKLYPILNTSRITALKHVGVASVAVPATPAISYAEMAISKKTDGSESVEKIVEELSSLLAQHVLDVRYNKPVVQSEKVAADDYKTKKGKKGKGKDVNAETPEKEAPTKGTALAASETTARAETPKGGFDLVLGLLDLRKENAVSFIHRACIAHLWRSHGAKDLNYLHFHHPKGPSRPDADSKTGMSLSTQLVFNLNRQHRAAPTELNVFSLLTKAAQQHTVYAPLFRQLLTHNISSRGNVNYDKLELDDETCVFDAINVFDRENTVILHVYLGTALAALGNISGDDASSKAVSYYRLDGFAAPYDEKTVYALRESAKDSLSNLYSKETLKQAWKEVSNPTETNGKKGKGKTSKGDKDSKGKAAKATSLDTTVVVKKFNNIIKEMSSQLDSINNGSISQNATNTAVNGASNVSNITPFNPLASGERLCVILHTLQRDVKVDTAGSLHAVSVYHCKMPLMPHHAAISLINLWYQQGSLRLFPSS